jgi:hypothetical protein
MMFEEGWPRHWVDINRYGAAGRWQGQHGFIE